MSALYRFSTPERRGVFVGLRAGQLAVVGAAVAAALLLVLTAPGAVSAGMALALILGAWCATALPVGGRTGDQWLPVLVGHLAAAVLGDHRHRDRSSLAGHRYRSGQRSASPVSGRPVHGARLDVAPPPPFLRGVELLSAQWHDTEIGVLADRRRGALVAVLHIDGIGGHALTDTDERDRLLALWGGVLVGSGRSSGIRRLQLLERTGPDGMGPATDHLGRNSGGVPRSLLEAYRAVIDRGRSTTAHRDVHLAIEVRAPGGRRSGGDAARRDAVGWGDIGAELDRLVGALHGAEIGVRAVLGPRSLAALLRTSLDPFARRALDDRASAHPELAGASPLHPWPAQAAVSWGTVRAGSVLLTTYWVAEWPRTPVPAGFLAPLLGGRGPRSVALVIEPQPPEAALRSVEAARVDDQTTQSFRDRFGFRQSVRRERAEEATARAEEELNDGELRCRFAARITVGGRTDADLASACADLEVRAAQAGLELRREDGAQDTALTCTLPLCRGLS